MKATRSRQEFYAAVIQKYTEPASRLLWFSTDPKVAPPQVCLLLTAARRPVGSSKEWKLEVELNGQENFRTGKEVELIEASHKLLRVLFRRGHGVHPGRVDASESRKVREIVVRFNLAPRNLAYLKTMVEIARHDRCQIRFRTARPEKAARFTRVALVRP
jgi:hypothetical protein